MVVSSHRNEWMPMDLNFSSLDAGTDFALGSVRGVRCWDFNSRNPQLIGKFGHIWQPGENEAGCYIDTSFQIASWYYQTGRWKKAHNVEVSCSCGFYAYWSRWSTLGSAMNVTGIIEGYGHVVMGPKGFRSEKSRILALALNKPLCARITGQLRATGEYYSVPVFRSFAGMISKFPVTNYYKADKREKP